MCFSLHSGNVCKSTSAIFLKVIQLEIDICLNSKQHGWRNGKQTAGCDHRQHTATVSATNKSVFLKKSFAHFIHEYFNLIALDPTPSLLPPFRRPWVAQVTAGVSSKPALEKKRSSNRLSLLLINKQMLFKSGVKKYIRPDMS